MKNIYMKKKALFFVLIMGVMGLYAMNQDERTPTVIGSRESYSFELMNVTRDPIWVSVLQESIGEIGYGGESWVMVGAGEVQQYKLVKNRIQVNGGQFVRYKKNVLGTNKDIQIQIYTLAAPRESFDFDISTQGRTVFVAWDGEKLYSTGTRGNSPSGLFLKK